MSYDGGKDSGTYFNDFEGYAQRRVAKSRYTATWTELRRLDNENRGLQERVNKLVGYVAALEKRIRVLEFELQKEEDDKF